MTLQSMYRTAMAGMLVAGLAACAATPRQTTGEYIDDAWITSKVRGAFDRNLERSAAQIRVDTYRGEVQLSGFVADPTDVGRAAAVAGGVRGVKAVRNDILVKK
jgi:osmotically-inducible protein OsmY